MSTLVVVAFDDINTADMVRADLEQMESEHLVGLEDLVVVKRRADGKVKIHQSNSLAGAGALSGSFWGLLIGLLFWAPWLGMAIGALSGAAAGHFGDIGIDDNFIKEVGDTIEPDSSAVFALVAQATPGRVTERLAHYNGKVLQTSLSAEDEAKLRDAFGEEVATA